MIHHLSDCLAIRTRLAEADLDFDAYDPEVVARIVRATGSFEFAAVGDSTGVMS